MRMRNAQSIGVATEVTPHINSDMLRPVLAVQVFRGIPLTAVSCTARGTRFLTSVGLPVGMSTKTCENR